MMFKHPHVLWSLFILPILFFYIFKKERSGSIFSSFFSFFKNKMTLRIQLFYLSKFILLLCLGLFIIALARPQKGYIEEKMTTEGINIVLALDISSSMKAEDFNPNRLGAASMVAKDFINGRKTDKIDGNDTKSNR